MALELELAAPEDWDRKAQWMRAVGAARAQWYADGSLSSLELGSVPGTESDDSDLEPPAPRARRSRGGIVEGA